MSPFIFLSCRDVSRMVMLAGLGLTLVSCPARGESPTTITPQTLVQQLETPPAPLILDVRSEAEFAAGHIPGAVNLPYRELPLRLDELQGWEEREMIVYCETGVRATVAELVLEQAGFQQVLQLAGHLEAWRQVGLPIDTVLPESTPYIQ